VLTVDALGDFGDKTKMQNRQVIAYPIPSDECHKSIESQR